MFLTHFIELRYSRDMRFDHRACILPFQLQLWLHISILSIREPFPVLHRRHRLSCRAQCQLDLHPMRLVLAHHEYLMKAQSISNYHCSSVSFVNFSSSHRGQTSDFTNSNTTDGMGLSRKAIDLSFGYFYLSLFPLPCSLFRLLYSLLNYLSSHLYITPSFTYKKHRGR